jgi:uncharacterized protein YecT (DUF1311 family)
MLALAACHRASRPPAVPKPVATAVAPVLKITPPPSATPLATPPTTPVTAASSPAEGARAGRRGVSRRHDRHRLIVDDRTHPDQTAHRRASPGGHSVIARSDAPPQPVRDPSRSSAAYKACIAAARGFTAALGDCHSAELARQGARVNQLYGQALASRSGRDDARLQESQNAWRRRRDAQCQAVSTAAIDIQREGACRIDMTAHRAEQLGRLVKAGRRGRS